jgi:peptidoglycan/LPS O-acetylase OafA/YrhL
MCAAYRNIQLDGLRGIAALNVAIFHTILGMDESLIQRVVYGKFSELNGPYDWLAKIVLKVFSGETAVFIFFVLSGAVLFQNLMRDRSPTVVTATRFIVRRTFRIYPALIACLLFMTAVSAFMGHPIILTNLLFNAFLYDFPINGVTWTLNVEMVGVAFVLLAYFGYRVAGLIGLGVVVTGIWLFLKFAGMPIALTFKYFWFYFVVGMIIPTSAGSSVAKFLPAWSIIPIMLTVIFFKSTLQQIAIGLLVTMLFYDRAGRFGSWLSASWSQFLGRISYSFYLYNFVVFVNLCAYVKSFTWVANHPIEAGLLASVVTVMATIPLAYLSMRYVEMPGIALGRQLTSRSELTKVQAT